MHACIKSGRAQWAHTVCGSKRHLGGFQSPRPQTDTKYCTHYSPKFQGSQAAGQHVLVAAHIHRRLRVRSAAADGERVEAAEAAATYTSTAARSHT